MILIDASIISVLFCQGRGIARTEQIAERERERERDRECQHECPSADLLLLFFNFLRFIFKTFNLLMSVMIYPHLSHIFNIYFYKI